MKTIKHALNDFANEHGVNPEELLRTRLNEHLQLLSDSKHLML